MGVEQEQGANPGGEAVQGLRQRDGLDVDAEQANDLAALGNGLGEGDHLPPSGKILVGAREHGVLQVGMPGHRLLPVGLAVNHGIEAKLAGWHPGIEVDEIVRTGEVDPGHVPVQQLAGRGEQGGEAEGEMYSGLPLAAVMGQRALPGQVADEGGGQIDGDAIQVDAVLPVGLQRLIKLAREHGLGIAAQALLRLAAHGLKEGLHPLVLAAELGRGVDGVTLVDLGNLAKRMLQGEQQQQQAEAQQQPLQSVSGKGGGGNGHGRTGRWRESASV